VETRTAWKNLDALAGCETVLDHISTPNYVRR
jgi:hypothetical protein